MKRGTLMVRADAGPEMGTGHVMRCVALAQSWCDSGGRAIFGLAHSTPAIDDLLRAEQIEIVRIDGVPGSREDALQVVHIAQDWNVDWLVADGYQFGEVYQKQLQSARPLLTIDDNGLLESYPSDLVVNQNAHAREAMYAQRSPATKLLLGPSYALLRDEFVAYRDCVREIPERGSRLLLTMGGSDAGNLTPRILPALAELPVDDLEIRVAVGGSATNADEVEAIAARFGERVAVQRNARNMAELMAWADLAIAGAGTTCWEMCSLGLPALLVVVAENQRFIAEKLARIGAAENAGCADGIDCHALAQRCRELLASRERRLALSQNARIVVDGRGRERVLEMMKCGDEMCA